MNIKNTNIMFYNLITNINDIPDHNRKLLMIMNMLEELSIIMVDISDNIVRNSDNIKLDDYVNALMNEALISINNNTNLTLHNVKDLEYGL